MYTSVEVQVSTSAGTSSSRRDLREALVSGEGDCSLACPENLDRTCDVDIIQSLCNQCKAIPFFQV
jgi:hypothetical protein